MEASEHRNWNMEIWTFNYSLFVFFELFKYMLVFILQSVVFILWLLVIASSPSSPCPTLVRSRDKWQLLSSANNLCKQFGPNQAQQNVGAWSGSKLFDTLMVFLKDVFEKLKKKIQMTKMHAILSSMQRVKRLMPVVRSLIGPSLVLLLCFRQRSESHCLLFTEEVKVPNFCHDLMQNHLS